MKRILLTGMSGTGKSTVVQALVARAYKAVDTDDGWCEPLADGRQQFQEDAIEALLATEDADVLRTTIPLSEVVATVLRLVGESPTQPAGG
ncbi:MAG TPA: hypothetical protein VLM11_14440 [Streptosporangiaceae bacterium]|nr:hypothetical protein [Streptosporangiaceae bacterium]